LNRRPTVYEGEFAHGKQASFGDVSATGKSEEVDRHASSHILVHTPDQIALSLLEAQAGWLAAHDCVIPRRTLLELVLWLEE
jgi:hypothetical protein